MQILGMIFGLLSGAFALPCDAVNPVPEALQVAYISKVNQQLWPWSTIETVPLNDLRVWVEKKDPTPEELLQQLGLIGTWRIFPLKPEDYQVTIFDVRSAWLCRPMTEYKEGHMVKGLPACASKNARPLGKRKGFSGCGHTVNTKTKKRGLDTYRISWRVATSYGFCVLPLSRFVSESGGS